MGRHSVVMGGGVHARNNPAFMVFMIAASVSLLSMVVFACGSLFRKRKPSKSPDEGDKTSTTAASGEGGGGGRKVGKESSTPGVGPFYENLSIVNLGVLPTPDTGTGDATNNDGGSHKHAGHAPVGSDNNQGGHGTTDDHTSSGGHTSTTHSVGGSDTHTTAVSHNSGGYTGVTNSGGHGTTDNYTSSGGHTSTTHSVGGSDTHTTTMSHSSGGHTSSYTDHSSSGWSGNDGGGSSWSGGGDFGSSWGGGF
nr:uncharacterized transmembrane protein DDB_G0289901-like [Ipomoea trifida]